MDRMKTLEELNLDSGITFTVDQDNEGTRHVCIEVKVSDDQLIIMSLTDDEVSEVAKLLGSVHNKKPTLN